MKRIILDNIEWLNTLNKNWINNIKETLSQQALHIIEHMQHMLDVLIQNKLEQDKIIKELLQEDSNMIWRL